MVLTVAGDIEALITGAKYIRALIPALVNIVYKKLLQYDITARAFETRSTSYEGPVDANLNENSPQILHRKMVCACQMAWSGPILTLCSSSADTSTSCALTPAAWSTGSISTR